MIYFQPNIIEELAEKKYVCEDGHTFSAPVIDGVAICPVDGLKRTIGQSQVLKLKVPLRKGFRDHGGRFPYSRDFNMPTIKCGVKTCAANYNAECVMPSLIEMDANGKCKGKTPRSGKNGK